MPLLMTPWYQFQLLEVAWPDELHGETWCGMTADGAQNYTAPALVKCARRQTTRICGETGSKQGENPLSSCQERQQSPSPASLAPGTRAAEYEVPVTGIRDKWSGATSSYMAEQRVQLVSVIFFILKNHRWQPDPLWALSYQASFSSDVIWRCCHVV